MKRAFAMWLALCVALAGGAMAEAVVAAPVEPVIVEEEHLLVAPEADGGEQPLAAPEGEDTPVPARDVDAADGGEDYELTIVDGVVTQFYANNPDGCYVVIPDGVRAIGANAFSYTKLTGISIPDSVTEIRESAFAGCDQLNDITIPGSVESISKRAFYKCRYLRSVTLKNGIGMIMGNAFDHCQMLTSIVIPGSVTYIGTEAFTYCTRLASVTLCDGVTRVDNSAFADCNALSSLSLPETLTRMGDKAFAWCNGLELITIPGSLAEIGESAFYNCQGLREVVIKPGVSYIGKSMFSECDALEKVDIPGTVLGIGAGAFARCDVLADIALPEGVEIIGELAFQDCPHLTGVTLPASVVEIMLTEDEGKTPFDGCPDSLVIRCDGGTVAETFARAHGIAVKLLKPAPTPEPGETMPADSAKPTSKPTATPKPTAKPTAAPTEKPAEPTEKPTTKPTEKPAEPTGKPVEQPTAESTAAPKPAAVKLSKCDITVKAQTYTGKALKPTVSVKYKGKALKKGTDYTVKYSNNTKVGTASVTLKGKGGFTGTVKKTFRINPKKVKGLKLKAGAKKITATWKKASGVTGYQLQYGTKKDFSKAKTLTVKKAATVKATLKKLKAKKTYYVRIRSYKTVKGKKYYSKWSAAAKVKTKE